jgi:hypothetical protein
MKYIISLILMICCMQVTAQGTCAPADLKGTGTVAVTELNKVGVAVGWWCPNATRPKLYAVRWNAANQELHAALDSLRTSTDPATAISAMANASGSVPISTLRDVWGPMEARLMASRPPTALWVVALAPSNASPAGTRPTFPWVGGVRGTISNGRITQGTPCDPTVGRMEGSTAYYGVNGRPDLVAVCVRQ